MSLISRRPRTRQPDAVTRINLAHPLARGLVGFWTPIGGRVVDVLDYATPSADTSVAAYSARGRTVRYNNTRTTYAHNSRYDVLGDITIAAQLDIVALDGYGAVLQKNAHDASLLPFEFRLGTGASGSNMVWVRGNSTYARFDGTDGPLLTAGQTAFVAATQGGNSIATTPTMYCNSAKVNPGTVQGSGTGLATSDGGSLYLGSRFDSVTYSNYAALYFGLWSRVLSDAEIASFRANPWQLFAPLPRRIWAPAAGGGTTFTITPSGGVVLSGAAALLRTRVQAASGGITFSGTAPQIRERAQVPTGGVVLSGTAPVTFVPFSGTTYTITPSGGITFSGAAAQLRTRVQVPTGGVVLSGAVSMLRTRAIVPAGGIVFSGEAPQIRDRVSIPIGGVTFSGTAGIIFIPAGGLPSVAENRISIGVSRAIRLS